MSLLYKKFQGGGVISEEEGKRRYEKAFPLSRKKHVNKHEISQNTATDSERARREAKVDNYRLGMKRPYVYLHNPLKIIGDYETLFHDKETLFPNSEEDRLNAAFRSNDKTLTTSDKLKANLSEGVKMLPYVVANTSAGLLSPTNTIKGMVNEIFNPVAGFSGVVKKTPSIIRRTNMAGPLPEVAGMPKAFNRAVDASELDTAPLI
jgi:hypothetical protein